MNYKCIPQCSDSYEVWSTNSSSYCFMASTELSPHLTSITINPLQPISMLFLLLPLDLGNHWFACSPHTYVYVLCLHLFSHLWAHICVHTHLEAGGQYYVSSLMILCFIHWGRVSYWDLFWRSPVLKPASVACFGHSLFSPLSSVSFHMASVNLNSGPNLCTVTVSTV